MLQETDMAVWQRQKQITKKDPQKNHRLGTVDTKITGGLFAFYVRKKLRT